MWLILNSSQELKKKMILLESTNTFRIASRARRVIAISDADWRLNDFLAKYWIVFWLDTEAIELMWENNRFAKKDDRISKDSRMKRMIQVLMIKDLIFDSTTKFLIRSLLKYSVWCFLDDLNLIWWLNRIIFVTLCQSKEANLNQRSKKKFYLWIKIIA